MPTKDVSEADFLDEIIAQRAATNPAFPTMVEEAYARRVLLREIADARKDAGLSRSAVATRMNTSASTVARLESGEANPSLSTLERFAAAVGKRIRWELVDATTSS